MNGLRSIRQDKRFRLAIGSLVEDYCNKFSLYFLMQVIQRTEARGKDNVFRAFLECIDTFEGLCANSNNHDEIHNLLKVNRGDSVPGVIPLHVRDFV